ncbi:hypothetical protein Cgig2_008369 [Carnegiea gigantea]|uniref:Uncharacterized protein n=1 Tax=Carnegiea gigantea TaxID=171969 RepID=A0A9Q1KBS0_9CARY|nr:hypothetical protein Cgig2_008369 [Carnegiea gigantea]
MINTGSSIDIITWDYLKKLMHPGCDIVPLVHPILGFSRQEVNPTSMIHLPVHFDDKLKAKNLEVDFLAVDVPTAYNVILGHPTLHNLTKREDELDLLRISPLGFGPVVLIHIMEVGLEVGSRPCANSLTYAPGLAGSLTPWLRSLTRPLQLPLLRPWKALPPAIAAGPSTRPPNHLFLPSSSLSATGVKPPAPPTSGAPLRL